MLRYRRSRRVWPARDQPSSGPVPSLANVSGPQNKDEHNTVRVDWRELRAGLTSQLERPGRIRVPSREEVTARIGANHPGAWQNDINWSRVCYGFQPELTDAWFNCAGAFRQEAQLERNFQNCIFWTVTNAVICFY